MEKRALLRELPSIILCLIFLAASFSAPGVVFANGEGGGDGVEGVPEAAVDEAGEAAPPATIADAFVGEELDYKIGFWFFDHVAVGKLTFKKGEDGGYEATLRAHATGVIDRILKRRRDKYTSYMYLSEDGTMFLTSRFERVIETRDKRRVKKKYVDYKNRILTWISWEDGEDERWDAVGFPRGVFPVDPLAAFYNFRAGAYGPPRPGGESRIPALPKDGRVPEIYFRILTPSEMAERTRGKDHGAAYLADALIGKDLFNSEKGELELFFNSALVPVYAVAKGVDYLGNVRGTLLAPEAKTVLKTAGPTGPPGPGNGGE